MINIDNLTFEINVTIFCLFTDLCFGDKAIVFSLNDILFLDNVFTNLHRIFHLYVLFIRMKSVAGLLGYLSDQCFLDEKKVNH